MADLSDDTPVLLTDLVVEAPMDDDSAEAVCVPVEELKKTAQEMEADFSKREHHLHRFPASLRPLGERYIVPTCVAIGPYHRGLPQVQEMEKVKRAAAYHFTVSSGRKLEEMHAAIRSVVDEARSLYDDDATAAGIGDAEFVAMMFHDACFLLQHMHMYREARKLDPTLRGIFFSNQLCIERDIMLLENQLPWLVIETLMSFKPVPLEEFIAMTGDSFQVQRKLKRDQDQAPPPLGRRDGESKPPAHLLGLVLSYITGCDTRTSRSPVIPSSKRVGSLSISLSATELAEIGISLTASKTPKFINLGARKGPLFGELFLPPLFLDDGKACSLVNMVAFETCTAAWSTWKEGEAATLCSYLGVVAMLMDREEDVHELRRRHLLQGEFTDKETLDFFKNLVKHVYVGPSYFHIMAKIEAYRHERWMCIKLHGFLYNNFRTIVTVFSVVGVLVGIFKTLLSIKRRQL